MVVVLMLVIPMLDHARGSPVSHYHLMPWCAWHPPAPDYRAVNFGLFFPCLFFLLDRITREKTEQSAMMMMTMMMREVGFFLIFNF
jgi:hypothetical protein